MQRQAADASFNNPPSRTRGEHGWDMSESFAEMLEESFANQKIKPGAILTGTVVGVNQDVVIVHAGLKSEAVISADQFFNEGGELFLPCGYVDVHGLALPEVAGWPTISVGIAVRGMIAPG